MSPAVTIRPARPQDASLAARLIYLTMGVEADWLFGQEKGLSTLEVLARLFARRDHRAAYDLTHLAERDGQAAGLLLAYPGRRLSGLNLRTGWQYLRLFGLRAALRLAKLQPAYADLVESQDDEFYISNIAVLPEYQGQGIGSVLMAYAEELACKAGLRKCSLIVAFGHAPARRLYERLGYAVDRVFSSAHPKVAEGSGGYHRMVKPLPALAESLIR